MLIGVSSYTQKIVKKERPSAWDKYTVLTRMAGLSWNPDGYQHEMLLKRILRNETRSKWATHTILMRMTENSFFLNFKLFWGANDIVRKPGPHFVMDLKDNSRK